jgi:hypothetical protein
MAVVHLGLIHAQVLQPRQHQVVMVAMVAPVVSQVQAVEVVPVQDLAKQVVRELFQHLSEAPPLMVLVVRVADGQIVLV